MFIHSINATLPVLRDLRLCPSHRHNGNNANANAELLLLGTRAGPLPYCNLRLLELL
jgi:hypothetical protein